jgi:hypothetical protein
MGDKRPGIPMIDPDIPQNIAKVLGPLKEHAEIATGTRSSGANGVGYEGWKRRSVTLGMLIAAGVLSEAQARALLDME